MKAALSNKNLHNVGYSNAWTNVFNTEQRKKQNHKILEKVSEKKALWLGRLLKFNKHTVLKYVPI